MAVDCSSQEEKKIKMFGFRIPGQGFYSMEIPEYKVKVAQSIGLLSICNGEASEEKIDGELKNLVNANWYYRVRAMNAQEFLVVFPNKSLLDSFSKLTKFQLSIYGLKVRLEKTERDPKTSSVL